MRLRPNAFSLTVVGLVLAVAPVLCAQSLQVTRADGTSVGLTAAQITALPHVTVSTKDHGTPAQFEGVPVSALLTLAGVQLGAKMRGPRLAEALLVEAADNYKVVFALAELDADFTSREILLADKRDGKPLDANEGPWRIIVPGDKRPARWIRQVTSFKIVPVK
jgi:hypothetical protein